MSTPESPRKAVLFCTCSGACPSMEKIDFWALAERLRLEHGDQIEFMALHPRLCEEDGERLMKRILTDSVQFITPACAVKRQEKLLRDGFAKAGVPMDSDHWIPVSMAQETTDAVFEKVKAALQATGNPVPAGA
jgi:heterodisulfide reductase subunit A-like polyferredoxin